MFSALSKWICARVGTGTTAHRVTVSAESLPAALPGFDLQVALKNTDNDPAFLRELLHEFAAGHRDDGARIRACLDHPDQQEARRLTHTLKGIAATFGAHRLHAAAAAMDTQLRGTQSSDCTASLPELTLALDEVLAAIDALETGAGRAAVA